MKFTGFFLAPFLLGLAHASPLQSRAPATLTSDGASLNKQSFDYVIVGGGTAGMAAAYEFSKDSSKRVLVIEAGGDPRQNDLISSYDKYTRAFDDPNLNWPADTVPQQSAGGKSVQTLAGKGIGGTSNINGGVFSLPPSSQVDALGSLVGQKSYANDVFSALKSVQNYRAPTSAQNGYGITATPSEHGTGGPLSLGFPSQMKNDAQDNAFRASARSALQIPFVNDLGTGGAMGSSFLAKYCVPEKGDTRVSSATAFFSSIESSRSNLVVLINSRASKIVWKQGSSSPATASAVEFQQSSRGPTFSVNAKKVVVASGTLRSPKFLEMSGVGGSATLNKINVKQVVNLPGVGANLIDQVKVQMVAGGFKDGSVRFDGVNSMIALPTLSQLMSNTSDMRSYLEMNIDSWAQANVNRGGSVSKSGLMAQYKAMITGIFDQNWPAAEYYWIPIIGQSILESWNFFTFARGTAHATSNSVWSRSDIDPNYLGTSIDMDFQIAAMRGARRIFQGRELRNVISGPERRPGFDASSGGIPQSANGGSYGRFERWQKYVTDNVLPLTHYVGTCAMMPQDQGGVVGADYKVYQTANVYVIDASIISLPMGTHVSSVVYGTAIKAARMISKA